MKKSLVTMGLPFLLLAWLATAAQPVCSEELATDDGYRGIWYFNQPSGDEYKFKYSGGMATYPQQHIPIAVFCPSVEKTFFVYGGTTARSAEQKHQLLHMISYFDHRSGTVPRPRILLNKQTDDAHDNPVLSVDGTGHLWVFSPSHGTSRPSFIHRSVRPFDISEFQLVSESNFSYPQPWHVPGHGFVFLHTRYGGRGLGITAQRSLGYVASKDGNVWSEPQGLAGIERGDYQISWLHQNKLATAFDHHPPPLGLNARANIYYLATSDAGRTWQNAAGDTVELPVTDPANSALAYDSMADKKLVYLKDINFDEAGNPAILFMTSAGFEPGPRNDPREWRLLRWTKERWVQSTITTSGNNYDHGSLYFEGDGQWRIIAPTTTGPQPGNPGGEMAMWISEDHGQSWQQTRQLTRDSLHNHTYARRPLHADSAFYALWADGHAREPSESSIYFTDREGHRVWRLPAAMTSDVAVPEVAWEAEQ